MYMSYTLYVNVYVCVYVYVNATLPIHPTQFPPRIYMSVLYICVFYFYSANRFLCTIFLDSKYMQYLFFSF